MLASIQLNSNRPENIIEFVENVNQTATNPSEIEILFHIDNGDNKCKNILDNLAKTSKAKVRYLQTDIIKGYKDLWKPLNELLKITDPNVYFITNFSDEYRFETNGWDDIIKKYINYYDDDIFRIRLSRYRFRNYSDAWECVFAPDSLAFYTKKWLNIVNTWCPCLGPDSWQQLVSFYLANSRPFDHIHYNRDVVEPFIKFSGEGASIGLTGLKARQRIRDNLDLWFETLSPQMQEKAKYAAAMLQTNIIMHQASGAKKITHNFVANKKPPIFCEKKTSSISFFDNNSKKEIEFFYENKKIYQIKYSVNKWLILLINNIRKPNYGYYAGGGLECFRKDIISQINVYKRMRRYGDFSQRNLINWPSKPKLFKKNKILSLFWTPTKITLLLLILILRITRTEKYLRLIKIKRISRLKKKKISIRERIGKMFRNDQFDNLKKSFNNNTFIGKLFNIFYNTSSILLSIVLYPLLIHENYKLIYGEKGLRKPLSLRKNKTGIFWPIIKVRKILSFIAKQLYSDLISVVRNIKKPR